MNKKIGFAIIVFSFLLSSCAANNFNDRKGFVEATTSALGGFLGWKYSNGDILTTTVGSTAGLVVGKYLSEYLVQDDYYFYSKETLKVLEINDKNKSKVSGYWKNPKSGNEGVIKIKGYYGSPECRLIEHIYVESSLIGRGKSNNVFDAACREESGQWAMIR